MSGYIILLLMALTLVVSGGATWEVQQWRWEAKQESAISAQKDLDLKQCNIAQQATKEANDALQKDHDAIATRLNSLKLQHPASCMRVSSKAKPASSGNEHAGQNGVSSDWLRDYAAECEGYRSEVISLSKFIDKERE